MIYIYTPRTMPSHGKLMAAVVSSAITDGIHPDAAGYCRVIANPREHIDPLSELLKEISFFMSRRSSCGGARSSSSAVAF